MEQLFEEYDLAVLQFERVEKEVKDVLKQIPFAKKLLAIKVISEILCRPCFKILSWMAEEERGRIRKRQRESIDLAFQNGTAFWSTKGNHYGRSLNKSMTNGNQERSQLYRPCRR
ncbi:hypothetical protein ACFWMS_27440 [Peribacillus butanolivorans]|uniref:hypothetical protein n=1 Tax=Peribacillus butanolivorans TaxID=421767 RepID=UPI00365A88EA